MQSKKFNIKTLEKYEFASLGFMLVSLHIALYQSDMFITSTFLLIHLGFFLFWQPLFSSKENINNKTLLLSLVIIFGLYYFLGWWFIALWIIFLTGLTGGSALIQGMSRSIYALAATILFLNLSLAITPNLFQLNVLSDDLNNIIFYTILLACLFITTWPNKQIRIVRMDYLHSMLISSGLFAFYLCSILISFTYNKNYIESLLTTSLLSALFLLLISLFWFPKHGFSGLGQKWEQHILNIGNPFETWVKETALLGKNKKLNPEIFLQYSIEYLLNLPWVSGILWRSGDETEFHGAASKHLLMFEEENLKIELHSHIPMGHALNIHAQLLMQLMSYFYQSKLREVTLKNQTHLKAVYETGSKLTHDIKNILQSLQTLTMVVQASEDTENSHQLLEKQLPMLTQRLQNTLDKLQTKTDTGQSFKLLSEWWIELKSRYHGREIIFSGETEKDIEIDTDIFDTILENLLENARSKRKNNPEISITALLHSSNKCHYVEVRDSGESVPDSKVNILFNQILPSKDGYGIGLYQSAQLARKNNYELTLIENKRGKVCFRMSSKRLTVLT